MLGRSDQSSSAEEAPQAEGKSDSTSATKKTATGGKEASGNGSGAKATGANGIAPAPQTVASQAEALAALLGDPQASVKALDFYRVPLFLLPIYQAAAAQYGVPWEVLAAINEVETDYGNDLSVSTAGAVGWMQFMPQTWLMYGVDEQDAGYADPYNPVDAIFAAARYLRAAGAANNLKEAIFAYNHSQAYVESVTLRAKLIAHYPSSVIATLTGLAEGETPVKDALATGEEVVRAEGASPTPLSAAGDATATRPGSSGLGVAPTPQQSAKAAARRPRKQRFADLSAPAGKPVVAVQDGKILAIGRSRSLGRYLVIRDIFGDVFTYAGLGSIAKTYVAPKTSGGSVPGAALVGAEAAGDPAPAQAATAGSQPSVTLHVKGSTAGAESQLGESGGEAGEALGKVRMFADPANRFAKNAIAKATRSGNLAGREHALRVGSVVTQGTVLAGTSVPAGSTTGEMKLSIRPAGDDGTVEAQPVLQSWRQLYAALHPQGARRETGLLGATAGEAFLLSKGALQKAVLSDPGIALPACAQQDVSIGAIGTRPLATLVFLSRSGLKPTLAAMPCERRVTGGFSAPGSAVHAALQSLPIAAVNGVPIAGHEGARSVTDLTIRTLLTLQGKFAPSEIVSLMHYAGASATVASPRRSRSILVVFSSSATGTTTASGSIAGVPAKKTARASSAESSDASAGGGIGTSQWGALVHLIGSLPQSTVSRKRSSAAVSDPNVRGAAATRASGKP